MKRPKHWFKISQNWEKNEKKDTSVQCVWRNDAQCVSMTRGHFKADKSNADELPRLHHEARLQRKGGEKLENDRQKGK